MINNDGTETLEFNSDGTLRENRVYNVGCDSEFGMSKIKKGSVKLLLTDPPYNIAKDNNFESMGRAGIDFGKWDKGFDLTGWMKDIPHVLDKDGSVIIFNSWEHLGDIAKVGRSLGLIDKDIIRWRKANPMPRNPERRYISDCEYAIWFVRDGAKWTFNYDSSKPYMRPEFEYSDSNDDSKRFHPTQKPTRMFEDLINIHSKPGELVLDCFMGSGTTAISCINSRRKFIGFEKDTEYGYYPQLTNRIREHLVRCSSEYDYGYVDDSAFDF